MLDRIPPQNLEAEQALLGSMLMDRNAYYAAKEAGITPADFYREVHLCLYQIIAGMHEHEQQVDPVTVQEELRKRDMLDQIGGIEYVLTLYDVTPTAVNAPYYAKIVREYAARRQWIDLAIRLEHEAYDTGADVGQLSMLARDGELEISSRLGGGEWVRMSELLPDIERDIIVARESERQLMGIPCGIGALDRLICGAEPADTIYVAGLPSMGKTAFALQWAVHAASGPMGIPVGIFSLEMTARSLVMRELQASSKISGYKMLDPIQIDGDEFVQFYRAIGKIGDLPIFIDDDSDISYEQIFPRARRAVQQFGVRMFILDYVGLVDGPKGQSRNIEVGTVGKAIKSAAKRLNVPFIVLSQLSRDCVKGNRAPVAADLRDSGDLEAQADKIIFPHRPDAEKKDEMLLIVAKDRNHATGSIPVYWDGALMRFGERVDREG